MAGQEIQSLCPSPETWTRLGAMWTSTYMVSRKREHSLLQLSSNDSEAFDPAFFPNVLGSRILTRTLSSLTLLLST